MVRADWHEDWSALTDTKIWRKVDDKAVLLVSDKLTRRYGEMFPIKQSYQFPTKRFYLFLTKMFREMVFNEGCPLALAQGDNDKDNCVKGKVQINCVYSRASLSSKAPLEQLKQFTRTEIHERALNKNTNICKVHKRKEINSLYSSFRRAGCWNTGKGSWKQELKSTELWQALALAVNCQVSGWRYTSESFDFLKCWEWPRFQGDWGAFT